MVPLGRLLELTFAPRSWPIVNNEAPQPESNMSANRSDSAGSDAPPDRPSPTELSNGCHGAEEKLTATTHQRLADVAHAYRRVATFAFLEVMQRHGEQVRGTLAAVGVSGKFSGDVVRAFAPETKLAVEMKGRNAVLAAGVGREWNAVLGGGRWAGMSYADARATSVAACLGQLAAVGVSGKFSGDVVRAVAPATKLAVEMKGRNAVLAAGVGREWNAVLGGGRWAEMGQAVATAKSVAASLGQLAAVGVSDKFSGDVVRAFAPATKLAVAPAFAGSRQSILANVADDQVVELVRLDAKRKTVAYRADTAIPELLNLTERQAQILDKMRAAITELTTLGRMAYAEQQTEAAFNRRIQIAILLATLAALLVSVLGYVLPRDPTPVSPEPVAPSTSMAVPHVRGTTLTPGPMSRTSPR